MSRRPYSDFYHGKPFHTSIVNGVRYLKNYGLKQSLRVIKHEFTNTFDGIKFPNGLVSGTEIDAIRKWYVSNAKPVTIVIPSYNDEDLITDCIASIHRTTQADLVNIIIVDDYCTNDSKRYLKKLECDNVQVVYKKKNEGFARAVNKGFKRALELYPDRDIILLNSDVAAHSDWLCGLQYGAYKFAEDVGIVGPKLLYPDGRIQSGGTFRNTDKPEWFDHYYRFQPSDYGPANIPQYCLAVTGACMYIKNKVIKRLGVLDKNYPFAYEEVDYCIRAWKEGFRTLYYPASTLTHFEGLSRTKNKTISEKEAASQKYFWEKWGDWFDGRNVYTKNGKLRIIYVLQLTGISGGHKIVFEHLNHLHDRGYDVELWALDKHPKWMQLNVRTRTFNNYNDLIKALSRVEAIKVATWWETAIPVWLSSVNKGIPAIIMHEIESSFYPNDPNIQRTVISSYRKEFNYITSNEYNLDEIRSLGLDAKLIPCGYDQNIYRVLPNIKRTPNSVIALARSFFQKNFTQTLSAWRDIRTNRPLLRLFGSESDIVPDDDGVEFTLKPSNEEANLLYNKSEVFIQTSYHEGFSLPILEAMAAGCAVVCTDAHGNRGFCHDGKNCLIVETDNIQETTRAIKLLLEDSALRDKLRKNALKTAKNYEWPVVAKRLSQHYEILAKQERKQYIEQVVDSL